MERERVYEGSEPEEEQGGQGGRETVVGEELAA